MTGPGRGGQPPFRFLLLAIVAIILGEPFAADHTDLTLAGRLSTVGLTVPIVAIGLLGMMGRRWWLWLLVAVTVVLLNGAGLARLTFLPAQVGVVAALVFLVWATIRVFGLVVRAPAVTKNLIAGALSAYLMLAVAWALAYGAVEVTWPGSISVPPLADGSAAVQVHTLMYFSAITIMTIGYGDVTPVAPIARTLAMLEGLAGVVFTTIVLGALVSTLIESRRRSREKPDGARQDRSP